VFAQARRTQGTNDGRNKRTINSSRTTFKLKITRSQRMLFGAGLLPFVWGHGDLRQQRVIGWRAVFIHRARLTFCLHREAIRPEPRFRPQGIQVAAGSLHASGIALAGQVQHRVHIDNL